MKITIWTLTYTIPQDEEPCRPEVFATEEQANAAFDAAMRNEWNSSCVDEDYPGAEEAHARRAEELGWGRYRIDMHEIETPTA